MIIQLAVMAASCYVMVSGEDLYHHTDMYGNPRYNPDLTLYPNDMLGFRFQYSFGGGCVEPRVGPVLDAGAVRVGPVWGDHDRPVPPGSRGVVGGDARILVAEANRCHGAPPRGGGGEEGYDTGFGVSRDCGQLSLTVSAYVRVCTDSGCHLVPVRHTAHVTPRVVAPVVHLDMERHMLLDPHGYPAMNLDGTYYTWDPVGLEHRVTFQHKDARAGTIQFRYDRTHPGLVQEGGFSCDAPCSRYLEAAGTPAGTGFLPYSGIYGNGDGMYAYAAPSKESLGDRHVWYRLTVLNAGVPVNVQENGTGVKVVSHDPVYGYHPYTVLADGHPRAYDDRHGVIMRYDGSLGSGPGDDGALHPDRRSKITNFYPWTVARSASALVEPMYLDPDIMSWNSTWAPLDTGGYLSSREAFARQVRGHQALPDHPFHSMSNESCRPAPPARHHMKGCHAMFLHATYGAVRFEQPLHDVILVENRHKWYDNVTVTNAVASDGWAGSVQNLLFNYSYTYPHTELSNEFIAAIHDDRAGDSLRMRAVPYGITHRSDSDFGAAPGESRRMAVMLDEYILAKTLRDTGDHTMAEMAATEMYGMEQGGEGAGSLRVRLNKTSLQFWSAALLAEGYGNALDMSVYEALEHEAALRFVMWRNDDTTHAVVVPFQFDVTHTHMVHSGDVAAEAWRLGTGQAAFTVPYGFGTVSGVSVGGDAIWFHGECHREPCVIPAGPGEVHITARNDWGGRATGTLFPEETPSRDMPRDHLDQLLALAAPLLIVALLIVAVRYAARYAG